MKLYVANGTSSLFPHILACEVGIPIDLERVDLSSWPRRTMAGADDAGVNPNLYVPGVREALKAERAEVVA